MTIANALTLILGLAAIAIMAWDLIKNSRDFRSPAILTGTAIFAWSSLVVSPPVFSAPLMQNQPKPEQELKATSTSGEYVGLEYVQGTPAGELKTDEEIISMVKDMNESVSVQSSNGSVL